MTATHTTTRTAFAAYQRGRVTFQMLLGIFGALSAVACLDRPIETTIPETHNVFLTRYKTSKVDKIDVLFMIDNSLSMADKQKVLAAAVPQLLHRLTSPDCVDPNDPNAPPVAMADPNTPCANPAFRREFDPVSDLHIGVITSSLGDFGGKSCIDGSANADGTLNPALAFQRARNDKAELLGTLPRASTLGAPFLSWTPQDAANYLTSAGTKEGEFRNFVIAAGEHGCGFEMTLESWYRFLVDPEPPASVDKVVYENKTAATVRSKQIDDNILTQRKQFLRPDSLLAIVMLSDENDCSLKDSGASFLLSESGRYKLKGGSAACKTSPNDPCCYSCDFAQPPAGCTADPTCTGPNPTVDETNLRCFKEKERYGYDFLFPTARYVNALRLKTICPYQNYGTLDCDCKDENARVIPDCVAGPSFPNPIFDPKYSGVEFDGEARTLPELVFLTGIVGVPWQDIAMPGTEGSAADLRYRLASDIDWSYILPGADGAPPVDPLMREQIAPRSGIHPVTKEPIGLPTADGQRQLNGINWHDWENKGDELQYACVFDITQPLSDTEAVTVRDCSVECGDDAECEDRKIGCPCIGKAVSTAEGAPLEYPKSPLCQAPDGSYGKIQQAAKAYPGTRQLEVLRGHNQSAKDNSVVASICPKDLDWKHRDARGYGYNPAVQALVDRLKTKLTAACLPRQIVPDDGKIPCRVMEAIPNTSEWANCTAKKRADVEPKLREAVLNGMRDEGLCDGASQPACSTFQICELQQLVDGADAKPLTECRNTTGYETSSPVPGFCYVDPDQNMGSASVVHDCPSGRKRMLRIVGDKDQFRAPAPGSWTFIGCAGAAYKKAEQ